jgi:L-ascorbate metabolism protein UlaG (beta-lactamase superfamily)
MRLTHYGHACVLLELPQRVLIDPGGYSFGFEHLTDLDLVLITHSHADHVDVDRLRYLLRGSPQATVVHSPGAAHALSGLDATVAEPGDKLSIAGVDITVTGSGVHALVHPDLPVPDNNGYLLNGAVLHPGDALDRVGEPVDVLLVPAGGPWMKIGEAVEYLRAVAPRVAVPIHQAGLAPVHQRLHRQLLSNLAPRGTEVVDVDHAVPREL